MRNTLRASLVLVAAVLAGCAPSRERVGGADSGVAATFESALARRAEPVMRHLIADRVYYYVTSPCCDVYNPLFDARGKYVCAPDGGFSGRGDGRCPADLNVATSGGESVPNPFYKR